MNSIEELNKLEMVNSLRKNRAIVLIDTMDKLSIRLLEYATTISDHIVVINMSDNDEQGAELKQMYTLLNTDIPLYIKYYPNGKDIVDLLLDFINSEEYGYKDDEFITIVLGEIIVDKPWQRLLHNRTGKYIARRLLKYNNIKVARVPF